MLGFGGSKSGVIDATRGAGGALEAGLGGALGGMLGTAEPYVAHGPAKRGGFGLTSPPSCAFLRAPL
jgi:hypothetical protein